MKKYKIIYTKGIYYLFRKRFLFYTQISAHASLEDLFVTLDKIHYQTIAIESLSSAHSPPAKK